MRSINKIARNNIASLPITIEEILSLKFSRVELNIIRLRTPTIKEGTSGDGPSALILDWQVKQTYGN